jgi:TPR repeat protein
METFANRCPQKLEEFVGALYNKVESTSREDRQQITERSRVSGDGLPFASLSARDQESLNMACLMIVGASSGDQHCLRMLRSPSAADMRPKDRSESMQFQREATHFYRQNAETNLDCAYYSACRLLFGIGVQQNVSLAADYLWMAVRGGHSAGQYLLCAAAALKPEYLQRSTDFSVFILECVKQSADQGYPPAQAVYGVSLMKEGRFSEAVEYYRRSAEQGDESGQHFYGASLYKGLVRRDLAAAVLYLKLSADQGDASSQCDYGLFLMQGECVPKNPALAVSYFKLSADQGCAVAQFNYGRALAYGEGIPANLAAAASFFRLSADQGYAPAQHCYGAALMCGEGVERDLVRAGHYLRLAVSQGLTGALADLLSLQTMMRTSS